MTTRMFNGSTFTFDGDPIAKVTGISFRAAGETVDVTDPGDAGKLFEGGVDDLEVTIDLNGGTPPARGAVGSVAIGFADGSPVTTEDDWVVTQSQVTGRQNSRVTSQITIKPTLPVEEA